MNMCCGTDVGGRLRDLAGSGNSLRALRAAMQKQVVKKGVCGWVGGWVGGRGLRVARGKLAGRGARGLQGAVRQVGCARLPLHRRHCGCRGLRRRRRGSGGTRGSAAATTHRRRGAGCDRRAAASGEGVGVGKRQGVIYERCCSAYALQQLRQRVAPTWSRHAQHWLLNGARVRCRPLRPCSAGTHRRRLWLKFNEADGTDARGAAVAAAAAAEAAAAEAAAAAGIAGATG